MRRVSYHQSVFDLLGVRPAVLPEARAMIEACEARLGRRLPEAVRDWYIREGVVHLRDGDWEEEPGYLWGDYSNEDYFTSLYLVLAQFEGRAGPADRILAVTENQHCMRWFIEPDGGDDPPVIAQVVGSRDSEEWVRAADTFSGFVFLWMAENYEYEWTPLSQRSLSPSSPPTRPPAPKPYLNGLCLYAPAAEPLAPPYLDYLLDHLGEEGRSEIEPGVTQYRLRGPDGTVRITSDRYGEPGGIAAWWLHGSSEDGIFRLARRVLWCRGLRESLRAFTERGRAILDLAREAGPG